MHVSSGRRTTHHSLRSEPAAPSARRAPIGSERRRGRLLSPFKARGQAHRQRIGRRSLAARAVVGGVAFGILAPFGAGVAAADAGANPVTCEADAAAFTPAGPSFVVDGGQYNIGYDARWDVFDQAADPSHSSDYSGSRPSDARHSSGHHGVDIFGPEGAPLVAPVDSVVIDFGSGGKGGNWVWLQSAETGEAYYYAHLERHADGLAIGATLPAGTRIGDLGDTGNAAGTAPHLHFEIHPGGRGAASTNPFDQLMAWRNAEGFREAVGALEADTFESICRIGEAWYDGHPAFEAEDGSRRFFLSARDLAEIGAALGLPESAVQRIADASGVLGYANGARNPDADTISIVDLRAAGEAFVGGSGFDAAVASAQVERDAIETRSAVRVLAGALDNGTIERDGEVLTSLNADDIRRVAPELEIPSDIADALIARIDDLGWANGIRNPAPGTVTKYDLEAVTEGLRDGLSLDAIVAAAVEARDASLVADNVDPDRLGGVPIS